MSAGERRLTPRGLAFLLTAGGALAAAFLWGSLVAGAVGIALVAALLDAATRAGKPEVTGERAVDADLAREGARLKVTLLVRARGHVEVTERPPPGLRYAEGETRAAFRGERRLAYEVEALAPGRWSYAPLALRASDPLGLVEHVGELAIATRVTVYPRLDALREGPVDSRISLALAGPHATGSAGPGSDFYALRGYQEGDTMRDVNWRASARTSKGLIVNQREKESQSVVTFFFDARAVAAVGTPTQCAYVHQVRALATLASFSSRRRDRPRLVTYGATVSPPVFARAGDMTLTSLLDPLLDTSPAGALGLRQAIEATLPALRPRAPVVVVTSLLQDDSIADALSSLRALEQHVTLLAVRPAAVLAAAGADPVSIEAAARKHQERLDAARAQGARVVDWAPAAPLPLAFAEEAMR